MIVTVQMVITASMTNLSEVTVWKVVLREVVMEAESVTLIVENVSSLLVKLIRTVLRVLTVMRRFVKQAVVLMKLALEIVMTKMAERFSVIHSLENV